MTRRILIVDDEVDICEIVQAALEEVAGWQAVIATSGTEGLQIAQTQVLDAILLDVSMPGMDGLQMLEALKGNPSTQHIPVILLTSKVLARDRSRFAPLAIAGVLTKPFSPLDLGQEIAQRLNW
ncbi:MAG TPA: response regulator [Leptolyngbyaceae cyanobacterium M65_K2018_010]|nr:response regulator [Leptolyngbyaceae cyanobacterium M65_K2018_010]